MSSSIGEKILREILDEIIINKNAIYNYRGNEITNDITGQPLELDIYYPDLKLAFEFQGEQHYKETNFANAKQVNSIKQRDEIKVVKCEENGITLITINGSELGLKERGKIARTRPDIELKKMTFKDIQRLAGKGKRYRQHLNKIFPEITSTKTDARAWREKIKRMGIEIPPSLKRKSEIPNEIKQIVENGTYEEWRKGIKEEIRRYNVNGQYIPKKIRELIYYV